MSEEKKVTAVNLNTILMFVLMGIMGWLGYTTFDNSKTIAAQTAATSQFLKNIDESLDKVEKKLDDAVMRREFDSKMIQWETKLSELTLRMRELDIAILEMKHRLQVQPPK